VQRQFSIRTSQIRRLAGFCRSSFMRLSRPFAGILLLGSIAAGCHRQQAELGELNLLEHTAIETIRFLDSPEMIKARLATSSNLIPNFVATLPGVRIEDETYLLGLMEKGNEGVRMVWVVGPMRPIDVLAPTLPPEVVDDIERLHRYCARQHGTPIFARTNWNPRHVDRVHRSLVGYRWVKGKKEVVVGVVLNDKEPKAHAKAWISYDILPEERQYIIDENMAP
jgi:hypothetical protein